MRGPRLPPPGRSRPPRRAARTRPGSPGFPQAPLKAMPFEEYDRLSASGGLVPVYREMPGDLMTPVSAFRSISARSSRAFLLESVAGGERLARYSFLGRDPSSTLEARATGLTGAGPDGSRAVGGGLLDG